MLRGAMAIAGKDLKLMTHAGQGLIQALLLGLLLVFVFSLSVPVGSRVEPQGAAAIFWLASAFALVLVFNGLYALEERTQARLGLLLSPVPPAAIWLGKGLAGLVLLLACQLVFAPAAVVFLGQSVQGNTLVGLGALLAVDWGLVVLGSLLGALAQGQAARESILSVILFPLLLPLLLGGIKIGSCVFSGLPPDTGWLGIALAFDAVFSAAALVLFPFVYSGED